MTDHKSDHPEQMDEFFNYRASSYDEHMRNSLENYDIFYQTLSQWIPNTSEMIHILDIGIGTGNELAFIFDRAPQARITGIDLSPEMLGQLRAKYQAKQDQINLVEGSYLETELGQDDYQYAVSVMTAHHLLPEIKRDLYKKVKEALAEGGVYLEGDYYVSAEKSHQILLNYKEIISQEGPSAPGQYHIDIPLTINVQQNLLREAGFNRVELIWSESEAGILAAYK